MAEPALSEAEADRRLADHPQDIEALVAKGDARTAERDDRAAASFYRAALSAAAGAQPLPERFRPVIARAQGGLARAEAYFHAHLENALAQAGFPAGARPARFQAGLDMLLGRRPYDLQLQAPTAFYLPGLPQRRYYERSEFAWAPQIEAAAPVMIEELNAFSASAGDQFAPYIVSDPSRPQSDVHGLRDNLAWSTLYLHRRGGPAEGVAEHFPRTLAAVGALDLPHITVRAPSILFSRLKPGARIPPHHGVLNARLICHLPLVVPPGCGFRVAGEARRWREGELLVFDDSVEHEAWNNSDRDRIILIFDIWRPEVTQDERRALAAMFQAIDSYSR